MHIRELFDLTERVAIVTGGTGLYGTPISEALAEAGAHVVIASRNKARCKAGAAQLQENGSYNISPYPNPRSGGGCPKGQGGSDKLHRPESALFQYRRLPIADLIQAYRGAVVLDVGLEAGKKYPGLLVDVVADI